MAKRPKANTRQLKEPLPPRQKLKTILTLPKGLPEDKVRKLREVFQAALISTLGEAYLVEHNLVVDPPVEIEMPPVG